MASLTSHKTAKRGRGTNMFTLPPPPPQPLLVTDVPLSVLALICCHIDSAPTLLALFRSCKQLHTTNQHTTTTTATANTAAFTTIAWSNAHLYLHCTERLHEWTLPTLKPSDGERSDRLIPLTAWHAAKPAIVSSLHHWRATQAEATGTRRSSDAVDWVLAGRLMDDAWQPTTRVVTTKDEGEEVEVLSELTWKKLALVSPASVYPCQRARFVLSCLPHLQHLHYTINSELVCPPTIAQSFALVPHLRSLYIEQGDNNPSTLSMRALLDCLPHLTSLHCYGVYLSTQQLFDCCCHSALCRVLLEVDDDEEWEDDWTGREAVLDSSEPVRHRHQYEVSHYLEHGSREDRRKRALPMTTEQCALDLQRIDQSLLRASSAASVTARLTLLNYVRCSLLSDAEMQQRGAGWARGRGVAHVRAAIARVEHLRSQVTRLQQGLLAAKANYDSAAAAETAANEIGVDEGKEEEKDDGQPGHPKRTKLS